MNTLDPTLQLRHARADGLQLRSSSSATSPSALARRRRLGRWQRFIIFKPPTGGDEANNEGIPASAPANGPSGRTSSTSTRIRTPPPRARSRECEAGNEPYLAGQQVIGNVPGNQGTVTEGQR